MSLPSLGKYIPGKMFAFAGHSIIAKKYNIRISVSTSVNLLMMGFGIAGASLIGLLTLMSMKESIYNFRLLYQGGAACLITIISIIILKPEIYWKLLNWGLGVLKQPLLLIRITPINMFVLFLIVFIQNLLYLSGVVVITSGIIEFSTSFLSILLGVSCIANVLGFLAIFAPAGIGVREGIFLVMLTPIVGLEIAGLITIVTRLIQTVIDCILGVIGLMMLIVQDRTSK